MCVCACVCMCVCMCVYVCVCACVGGFFVSVRGNVAIFVGMAECQGWVYYRNKSNPSNLAAGGDLKCEEAKNS